MASVQQTGHGQSAYTDFDKQPIAGEWRVGRAKGRLKNHNPYDGSLLVEIPHADERDLDAAFDAATKAQKAWALKLPSERAEVLQRCAAIMDARREEIVSWLIDEAGSTRIKAELEWTSVRAVMADS